MKMPRRQSSKSSRYSETMTTISPVIPTPTAIAQSHPNISQRPDGPSKALMELSNAEMELFKVDMQLSKEEEYAGQLEGKLARCWVITAIALICHSGVLIVAFAFLAIIGDKTHFVRFADCALDRTSAQGVIKSDLLQGRLREAHSVDHLRINTEPWGASS
jgi:hypothetical protein